MEIIKDKTNTFPFRLWFEDGEIEQLAERRRSDCISLLKLPNDPALSVDKFIELYLPKALETEIILDPYADLQKIEGPDVPGATYFYNDHLEIKIDRGLTDEAEKTSMWGRYNSTAMHEAAHCILHPVLFRGDLNQQKLFTLTASKKISCLRRTIEGYYTGEWWEYQANIAMANLLMPKELFLAHFEMERDAYGIHSNRDLAEDQHIFGAVVGYLSNEFQVSKQAVVIRLQVLKQIPDLHNRELFDGNGFVTIGDILLGGK